MAIAVGLLALGAGILGLFVVLILYVPSIRGFLASLGRSHSAEFGRGVRAIRIIGWLHLVGLVCASGLMVHIHLTRTPEEYIVKWGSTTPGLKRLQDLRAEEPYSLDAYRHIVRHGSVLVASEAAERIGQIGEPARDVPLLQQALDRLGGHGPFTSGIADALKQLESAEKATPRDGPANGSRLPLNTHREGAGSRRRPFASSLLIMDRFNNVL
ncbi:MAG: hypothetical protein U1E27_09965 [Kiritimatiellia bacterium]|nr:hypothetical protein [Kiritimatiellia bacterium]